MFVNFRLQTRDFTSKRTERRLQHVERSARFRGRRVFIEKLFSGRHVKIRDITALKEKRDLRPSNLERILRWRGGGVANPLCLHSTLKRRLQSEEVRVQRRFFLLQTLRILARLSQLSHAFLSM